MILEYQSSQENGSGGIPYRRSRKGWQKRQTIPLLRCATQKDATPSSFRAQLRNLLKKIREAAPYSEFYSSVFICVNESQFSGKEVSNESCYSKRL